MKLQGIISIAGRPGLFKIIAQGKNNVIVESMLDKKRFPAHATDKISALEDISVYTTDEDVKLTEVYEKMYNVLGGKEALSHKEDPNKLRDFVITFLPNYDSQRVYDSDVRKLFQWYNSLLSEGLLTPEKAEETSTLETEEKKPKISKETKEAKVSKTPKSVASPKATSKSTGAKKVAAVKTGSSRGK